MSEDQYENLTQNRRCRCSGMDAYALCKSSASDSAGEAVSPPMKPLANEPAAWANAPYKNQFSVDDLQKNLTQNRL